MKELHSATNNFNYDNKLGEGGFGSVYWGQLWDGSQVIITFPFFLYFVIRSFCLIDITAYVKLLNIVWVTEIWIIFRDSFIYIKMIEFIFQLKCFLFSW